MNTNWTLLPLYYGEFSAFERSLFVYHRGFGEKLKAPCTGWLLSDGTTHIVVDVGPYEPRLARLNHGYAMERTGAETVRAALAAHHLRTEDIREVILTHLHWDHTSNVELFTNATFYVQRAEVEYAYDPLPWHRVAFDLDLESPPPWQAVTDRIHLLDGDAEVRSGITCHLLPGHTPGSQGIAVQTAGSTYLIAGDNIDLDENWEGDDTWRHRPGGIFVDLRQYVASLERMETLADTVLPAHDFSVFDRKHYPA